MSGIAIPQWVAGWCGVGVPAALTAIQFSLLLCF